MDRPFFIIGTQRSGTTLLRLMLDSHERLAVPPETNLMKSMQYLENIPNWVEGNRWHRRLGVSDEEFRGWAREFYSHLFEHYAALHQKQRWGDKSPGHVWQVERAAEFFPDAQFIGITRHPAAVALSLRDSFGRNFGPSLQYWYDAHLSFLDAGSQLGERFTLLRYEDLLTDTRGVLTELMEFLHEPWSETMLHFDKEHARRGGPSTTDGGNYVDRPLDPSRQRFRVDRLSAIDRELLGHVSPLARALGYEDLLDSEKLSPISSSPPLASAADVVRLLTEAGPTARQVPQLAELEARLLGTPAPPAPLALRAGRIARLEAHRGVRLVRQKLERLRGA